jgi:hypothetical protein
MILLPKEPIARPPYIIYRGNDPESRQFPLLKTGEFGFGFPVLRIRDVYPGS